MIVLLARVLGGSHRRHVAILLASAVACTLAGGALFAATQRYPFTTGLYWAITTATTVGYGDVTPHNAAGRVVASLVMLTTIPLLASVFALVTGAAAAAGIRRVLAMGHGLPSSGYRLVVGMDDPVYAILDELARVGDPVVLVADVDPAGVRPEVHLVRGERDGLVLGLVHDGRFLLGVDDDPVVSSGDRLLIAQPAPRKPVRR